MKLTHFLFITSFLFSIFITNTGKAQYLTRDLLFLKVGYLPEYNVGYKSMGDEDNIEFNGFAIQGEYNLNFDNLLVGMGFEYQNLEEDDDFNCSFIQPMISLKLLSTGGLFAGVGLSGKYMVSCDEINNVEYKKKIDLWANAVFGYYHSVGEGVFVDIEGRFGYNLTNEQFSEVDANGTPPDDIHLRYAYDIAFYIGIGTRVRASEY